MSKIPKGTWVEVEGTLLRAGRNGFRRPLDPPKEPAYVVRISGFLLEDAELGQQVKIRTIMGKLHTGKLRIQSPSYGHSFGHTVPELLKIGRGGIIS
jgi:hypothetical protein